MEKKQYNKPAVRQLGEVKTVTLSTSNQGQGV